MDRITASDRPPRAPGEPAVLGLVALRGLLGGIAIMALAALVGRSELALLDRSLRGNGALIVPVVGAPAAPLIGLATLPLWLVLAHAPLLDRPPVVAAALLAPAVGWALAALLARLGRPGLLASGTLALALLAVPGSFVLALPLAVALLAGLIVGAVGLAAFGAYTRLTSPGGPGDERRAPGGPAGGRSWCGCGRR